MGVKRLVLITFLISPLVLSVPGTAAAEEHEHDHDQEHRQHGAHVHGIAALNLALEGQEVEIELDSPAANIVGFEHAPSSESDHAALDKAAALLKAGDRLFRFNEDAGCQMENADVSSELLEEDHDEHEEHEGHADKKSSMHSHEEEKAHDHEDEEHEHEGHADIEAAYHFECTEPSKLTQLTVELFEAFPDMEKIDVQYVIESKQGASELTATNHVINF